MKRPYPFTLHVRRERTVDDVLRAYAPKAVRWDVVAYGSAACEIPAARWMWFYASKPRKGQRWANLNCLRRKLIWLPDLKPTPKIP